MVSACAFKQKRGFYTAFIYSVYTYNIHTNMAAVGMRVHIHHLIFLKKRNKGQGNTYRFQKAPGSS